MSALTLAVRRVLPAVLTLSLAGVLSAQGLNFGVLAGSPPSAGNEDGSGGGGLRFNGPESVVVDASGTLFIADYLNNTIRRVTPAGTVSTFAGLAGSPGFADGIGGAARFSQPIGLEIDGSGNLYVAEGGNNTIRKITPAGVVTTLAGLAGAPGNTNGTGNAARFNFPTGLALDGAGILYVADFNNSNIRQITPAGVVTTLAGTGGCGYADGTGTGAAFCFPVDLVWDSPSSTMVVIDYGNALIRKLAPGAVVTTFAGNTGSFCTNADGGLNVGDLCSPWNIDRDSLGSFYVTDEATHNIRRITAAGVISTLAGPNQALCPPGPTGPICPRGSIDGAGTAARFNVPEGIAFDASTFSLWVTDTLSNDLRKIALSGAGVTRITGTPSSIGAADGTGTGAQFDAPFSITRIGGNIYAVDLNSHTVRQITAGGVVTTIAGIPYTAAFADGPGASAAFNFPRGITANGAGTLLYIADGPNRRVRTVDPIGASHTVATLAGTGAAGNCNGSAATARFRIPRAVAFFGGDVYLADSSNNNIRKIDAAGNVTSFAGAVGAICPGAASVAGSTDGTGTAARFRTPAGIAADVSGNLYVSDNGNHTIRMITPLGVVTTVAGSPGLPGSADGIGASARLRSPNGLSFDGSGNLLIADLGNNVLRKYNPATGMVTTIAGTAGRSGSGPGTGRFANFAFPRQVITDASGNYVVADGNNHSLRISALTGLDDSATIDAAYGPVGTARQLSTSPNNATTWLWKQLRQPTGSTAALSSTAIQNPTFTPDVADYFTYQVTATNGGSNSTTEVSLRSALKPVIVKDLTHRPSLARPGAVVILQVQDLRAPVQLFFSDGSNPTVAATIVGSDFDRGIVVARVPATALTGYLRLTSAGTDAAPYYFRVSGSAVTTGPDQVSGTVTKQSGGAAVANAVVILLLNNNNNCGGGGGDVRDVAITDVAGNYLLRGDPGAVQVAVFPPLTAAVANGSANVTLSGTPSVAPIALITGTTVTGTATDGSSGLPLAGAFVNFDSNNGFEFGLCDAAGNFSFHLTPSVSAGDTKLEINPPVKTALSYSITNITVATPGPQNLGALPLAQGIAISGKLTRSLDGTPISGADMKAQPDLGGNDLDQSTVAGDGSYLLTVPPNQNVQVQEQTNSAPFVDVNNVSLTIGTQPVLQNFALADAGFITGIVTDSGTGLPIENLSIKARLASNFNTSVGYTNTCTDGSYTIKAAPGALNSVVVSTENNGCTSCNPPPPPPYANQTYKSGSNTYFYCEGTPISLASAGSTVSGINFNVPRSATVTGSYFTQASGCTAVDATVSGNVQIDDGASHSCNLGDTNNNNPPPAGTYRIENLPPSSTYAGKLRSCVNGIPGYSNQCSYRKLSPAYDQITVAAAGSAVANYCLGNQPTTVLGNNFLLSKSGSNINFVWNASVDLYHDHYRIYQALSPTPVPPPGTFPGNPFSTNTDVFSGTSISLPAGAANQFYLVVDTGVSGNIGPSGSYGN